MKRYIEKHTPGFPLLVLDGLSPSLAGEAHGEEFKERIAKAWAFYRSTLSAVTDVQINEIAIRISNLITKYLPEIDEELKGIARGSGLSFNEIIALNSRTELLQLLELPPHECTSLYFKRGAILGQTWDFAERLEDLTVILANRNSSGSFLMLTEPGMVGKIGLNSSGIGVSLNRLGSKRRLNGLPVHILLRIALNSKSISDFQVTLSKLPIGSESCIFLGDATGYGCAIELSGSRYFTQVTDGNYLAHTNHYTGMTDEEFSSPEDVEHSMTRFQRVEELVSNYPEQTVKDMEEILSDRSHSKYPICREYEASPTLGKSGTISRILMDLKSRTLYYTPGNPLRHKNVELHLGKIFSN